MSDPSAGCLFCRIASGSVAAPIVFTGDDSLAFLDHRPVFPGHTLLIPRQHYETLADLPAGMIEPLFSKAQLIARAVERAMAAEGTFVAINNRISQSVPHLHVHIVPRRKKDGLRGFFWPRQSYKTPEEEADIQKSVSDAVSRLLAGA